MKIRRLAVAVSAALALCGGTAAVAVPASASAARPAPTVYINSPIGKITQAENTYLHTHPINLTARDESTSILKQTRWVANPAIADSEYEHWGYWCAYATGTNCMNNIDGGGAGNHQGYWNSSTAGKNGLYDQYYSGGVTKSYPWGSGYNLYKNYEGNSVYEYYWTPDDGEWTGLALDGSLGEGGADILEAQSNGAAQEWVWDGNNRWVNVSATYSTCIDDGECVGVYAGYTSLGVSNGDPMYNQSSLGLVTEWHFKAG